MTLLPLWTTMRNEEVDEPGQNDPSFQTDLKRKWWDFPKWMSNQFQTAHAAEPAAPSLAKRLDGPLSQILKFKSSNAMSISTVFNTMQTLFLWTSVLLLIVGGVTHALVEGVDELLPWMSVFNWLSVFGSRYAAPKSKHYPCTNDASIVILVVIIVILLVIIVILLIIVARQQREIANLKQEIARLQQRILRAEAVMERMTGLLADFQNSLLEDASALPLTAANRIDDFFGRARQIADGVGELADTSATSAIRVGALAAAVIAASSVCTVH
jgi:uncharacterized coiled-coil protein SlyX